MIADTSMDPSVLANILNETETSAPVADTAPVADVLDTGDQETETKPKTEAPVDTDLQWDDEGDKSEEPEMRAPDQQDDAELAKIEEKNKWMKGRLAPVKEKLTKAEQELAALRAENEALKSGRPQAPQEQAPADLDTWINAQPSVAALQAKLAELDKKADDLTEKQYIDAKLELLSDLKQEKRDLANAVEQHYQQQYHQVASAEQQIFNDYTKAVLAKKEEFPEIDKAFERVNKNAGNLDLEIRRSLIFEGNGISPMAAELVNIIGNDKQAMSYLIAQSKLAKQTGRVPVQAIEYIGRLKSKIQAEASEAPDVDATIARSRKPGVPKEVRNHTTSEATDLQAWARNALKNNQRPW